MEGTETSAASVQESSWAQRCCSECGAPMQEVWRMKELGMLFIWLQCSRKACPAVYLHKERSVEMSVGGKPAPDMHAA